VKPRAIALAYFIVLLLFTGIYYWVPDTDFYHQSIQFEPNSRAHLKSLQRAMSDSLKIEAFQGGPFGTTVSFIPAHDFHFPPGDSMTFTVGYYYYNLSASREQISTLTSRCGPSEKEGNFYRRTLSYQMTTFASSSGTSITVHAQTPQVNECDLDVLRLLYRSIERTQEGFQAMVQINPDINNLIAAVSKEQLGYAPRMFHWDRFTRMLYFSVAAMTTTGFGDILPLTPGVRLLASVEALIGIALAGVFLNAVARSSR